MCVCMYCICVCIKLIYWNLWKFNLFFKFSALNVLSASTFCTFLKRLYKALPALSPAGGMSTFLQIC